VNANVNTAAVKPFGTCRLCVREGELRNSHFMPAALYPKNRDFEYGKGGKRILSPDQITAPLFCIDCEQRLNRNGENEVLRWLAPKAKVGTSPLQKALREKTPLFVEPPPSGACHFASQLGIDAEKFAYFGLTLVWRAAAHRWPMPGGTLSTQLDLGEHYEPLRRYLLGETGYPEHAHVMLTMCTDPKSQRHWMFPALSLEVPGMIVVPVMGMAYRFWFGRVIPPRIEHVIFFPSDGKPIFSRDCWDTFSKIFAGTFGHER
jgi:hypothetical protein